MSFNLLVGYHSSNQTCSGKIFDYLNNSLAKGGQEKSINIYLITEKNPDKLSTRSEFVKKANAVLFLLNKEYQKSLECMEALHFAKDLKKPIYGMNTCETYVPFGALGGIISGTPSGVIDLFDFNSIPSVLDKIIQEFKLPVKSNDESTSNNNEIIIDIGRIATPSLTLNFIEENNSSSKIDVLISYQFETQEIVDIIVSGLKTKSLSYLNEECSSLNTSSVLNAKCLVILMSKSYEDNFNAKAIVEKARQLNKPIIPVSVTRSWKPENWLALFLAGKLFYRITSKEQAYKKKHEWHYSQIDSFLDECILATTVLSQSKNESSDIIKQKVLNALNERIEECKKKLSYWPPKTLTNKVNNKIKKREPVLIDFQMPSTQIELNEINYTLQQVFHLPQDLFDKRGLPMREKFDCMISYQWDVQDLVRVLYMNLSIKNMRIWFDIWGGMRSNVNDSMSNAIECSKVILVFLTRKYLASQNCSMELNYACYCGKAFVFVRLEENLEFSRENEWINDLIKKFPSFDLSNSQDPFKAKINGLPIINLIAQAIRDVGNAQPDENCIDSIDDLILDDSDEIFKLKQMLNCALNEIEEQTGEKRFKKCTRCKKDYEEEKNKVGDCKMHSAYYVGGSIIAGRWVCCSQTDKEAFGCQNTTHIDTKREWTLTPDYGTHQYEPP
jgi:hypothetical protein